MSLKLTRQMKALRNTKKTTQNWVYFFLNCTLILIFFVLFWSLCPYFFLKNTLLTCCGLVWNKNWNYLNSGEDYFSTNRRKMSLKLTRQMKALKNTKKTTQNWVYFFLNCTLILIFFVLFWSLCPYFFLKNTFCTCCGLVWNKNWNYLNSGEDYFSTNRRKTSLKLTRQMKALKTQRKPCKLGLLFFELHIDFNFFRPLLVIVPLLFSEKYFFDLLWTRLK